MLALCYPYVEQERHNENREFEFMTDEHQRGSDSDQMLVYHILLKGHLDARWAAWFGDVTVTRQEDGQTLLICAVVDQAALYGLLRKVRDLNLPLLEVRQVGPGPSGAS